MVNLRGSRRIYSEVGGDGVASSTTPFGFRLFTLFSSVRTFEVGCCCILELQRSDLSASNQISFFLL